MNKTVNLSLQSTLLRELDAIARKESRSRSELMREAARMYIERKRRLEHVFALGDRIRRKRRITPADIDREIAQYRKRP
jgi:CopG family transcriptional regulator/antitoxin EndoAI